MLLEMSLKTNNWWWHDKGYLTSLSPSLLICEMGLLTPLRLLTEETMHGPSSMAHAAWFGIFCIDWLPHWEGTDQINLSSGWTKLLMAPYFINVTQPTFNVGFTPVEAPLVAKESTCHAGDVGSIPGLGRSLGEGNGNPLQYSCWEIPRTEVPGWLLSMGSQRGQTWLSDSTMTKTTSQLRIVFFWRGESRRFF